ncbi:MAG TPA: 3-keto-5-aminohexanoate cleavage protein [Thermomicrobiales bacterium]|nr:3-keto-5-aminohexanoate cleavage protein [Thermomicrobiales bacterium]
MIQVAQNGDRSHEEHPAVPLSVTDLVRDAIASVAAGAGAIHLHPRDASGQETLDSAIVNEVAREVRKRCAVPIGVTTEASIEPDLELRLAMIRDWHEPDYASVNISEEGSIRVMRALLDAEIGIEAGVWTVEDAEALVASGLGDRILRVLVEPGEMQVGQDVDAAFTLIEGIHQTLDRHGITAPRLQHGDGALTWPLLRDALARGIDTRIGFEDTLVGPDGTLALDNAALVRIACSIRDGRA